MQAHEAYDLALTVRCVMYLAAKGAALLQAELDIRGISGMIVGAQAAVQVAQMYDVRHALTHLDAEGKPNIVQLSR